MQEICPIFKDRVWLCSVRCPYFMDKAFLDNRYDGCSFGESQHKTMRRTMTWAPCYPFAKKITQEVYEARGKLQDIQDIMNGE